MSTVSHPPNRDSDPLLRAIATGDEHCPDGKALAKLGRLIRGEQPSPSDLRTQVETRLAVAEGQVASDDGERIDHLYEQDGTDPELGRLRNLFATIAPAPVDLRARVRVQLMASSRLAPITSDMPVSSRAQAANTAVRHRRLRLVVAVVVGHLAAVLVVAVLFANRRDHPQPDEHSGWTNAVVPPVIEFTNAGPHDWTQLPGSGFDLFALRQSADLRAAARLRFHAQRSAGAVACGLRWLQTQQDADGRFSAPQVSSVLPAHPLTGQLLPAQNSDLDHDAARTSHALATLAFLAEGGGTTSVDRERIDVARRALAALDRAPLAVDRATALRSRVLITLARVEGALLGLAPRAAAEQALTDLAEQLDPLVALDGFAVLAIETAQQGGLTVPPMLHDRSRDVPTRLPDVGDRDAGRLGLIAFTRMTLGYRDNPATAAVVDSLAALLPGVGLEANGATRPADTEGWLFATLALRETGGPGWDAWISAVQTRLLPLFVDAGPGLVKVSPEAVQLAPDAVHATASAVLDLQAAYRYLPLSASR